MRAVVARASVMLAGLLAMCWVGSVFLEVRWVVSTCPERWVDIGAGTISYTYYSVFASIDDGSTLVSSIERRGWWTTRWLPKAVHYGTEGGTITVPMWIPVVATVSLALGLHLFTRRQLKRGFCPACGYNLTGNVSGRCPECGAPINTEAPTSSCQKP